MSHVDHRNESLKSNKVTVSFKELLKHCLAENVRGVSNRNQYQPVKKPKQEGTPQGNDSCDVFGGCK